MDLNNDHTVDIIDVLALKPVFNSAPGDGIYLRRKDLTADTTIDIIDVLAIKLQFGSSCGP